tara:strand:+ start:593 stop:874 length:282 start_codon:yes stop_codon:yes gene_type:complete
MIDTDKEVKEILFNLGVEGNEYGDLAEYISKLLAEVKRLREDYEKMSEVLREHGMDICRHCRVIYSDGAMNLPHYPSLHPWHMDGMCMKELIE